MLIATAYIAVVIVALHSDSGLWADVIYSITIAAILIALLGALFGSGNERAFWYGFCLIAGIYMILTFGPESVNIRTKLVTHRLVMAIQPVLAPLHIARRAEPGFKPKYVNEHMYQTGPNTYFDIWDGTWPLTQQIGHCVWAILFGLIGGSLAVYFSKQRATQPPTA